MTLWLFSPPCRLPSAISQNGGGFARLLIKTVGQSALNSTGECHLSAKENRIVVFAEFFSFSAYLVYL